MCAILHWDISLTQNRDFKYLWQHLRLTVMNGSSLKVHLYWGSCICLANHNIMIEKWNVVWQPKFSWAIFSALKCWSWTWAPDMASTLPLKHSPVLFPFYFETGCLGWPWTHSVAQTGFSNTPTLASLVAEIIGLYHQAYHSVVSPWFYNHCIGLKKKSRRRKKKKVVMVWEMKRGYRNICVSRYIVLYYHLPEKQRTI